jgi:tetratricopeptide (TPR) repeat protein
MIASELRYLYYANRGELLKAAPHREQVEMHAAHVGSATQVEMWEPAALIPLNIVLEDVVELTRIQHRLEILSNSAPSLEPYETLTRAVGLQQKHTLDESIRIANGELAGRAPRSFIGWATVHSACARAYNRIGEHEKAKEFCLRALEFVSDEDREYVCLFLDLDIQMALADAGTGNAAAGLARIDGLLERHRAIAHPLTLGLLHEARARIAWSTGRSEEYERSLEQMERWFRPTGTPSLIAKCERLAELCGPANVDNEQSGLAALSEFITSIDKTVR